MDPNNSIQNPALLISEAQKRMIDETISKRLDEERRRREQEEQPAKIKALEEKIELKRKQDEDARIKKIEQDIKTYEETINKPKKLNEEKLVKTPEPHVSVPPSIQPPSPPLEIEKIIQETLRQELNAQEKKVNPAPKIEQKTHSNPFGLGYKLACLAKGGINAIPQIIGLINNINVYTRTGVFPGSSPIGSEKTMNDSKKPNEMIFPFTPLNPVPLKKNEKVNTHVN